MLLADSGGDPGSGAEDSMEAGTGLGAGAGTGEDAGSVIGDGAKAENVAAGAGSAGEVGDVASVGGTGGSMIGDASKDSSVAVGTSHRGAQWRSSGAWRQQRNGWRRCRWGAARLEKGERRISPSSSDPRNSSTSLRHFLALFAGGVFKGGGVVGDGSAVFGCVVSSQAGEAASNEGGCG